MNEKKMEYLENDYNYRRLVRTEILLMPLLIIAPLIVGGFFVYEWYSRGFLLNVSDFDGQLILGLIILSANILFGIPFIRDLMKLRKR